MAEDREIAGIRCMQVLDLLDDYVDGELSEARRNQIEAHLRGCDWCTKFGGDYASLVKTLRSDLLASSGHDENSSVAHDLAARILRSTDNS